MLDMFKKGSKDDPRQVTESIEGGRRKGENENPYLTARRSWNDHIGSVVSSRQTWQIIGILSLLIALSSIAGIIHFAGKSTYIPYVFEVDKHGKAMAQGALQPMKITDQRIIKVSIIQFIEDARTITPDIDLKRKQIFRLYGKLSPNDPATPKLNEWFNKTEDSNPLKRAEKEMVSIQIETILVQTKNTWQVDWIETTRNRKGIMEVEPVKMRALLNVYHIEPTSNTTEEEFRKNPFGIYIKDFSWSNLL